MNRIYTRTGDKGMTAIHGGLRVPKTDIRIEANGVLDELNVAVGAIRTSLHSDHQWQIRLRELQLHLMTIMSLIAIGLCLIFIQNGYSPTPFKIRNMALNSYASPDWLDSAIHDLG